MPLAAADDKCGGNGKNADEGCVVLLTEGVVAALGL